MGGLLFLLAACSNPVEAIAKPDPFAYEANVAADAKNVPVSTVVKVEATSGELGTVQLRSGEGAIPGRSGAKGAWVATERLEPGTTYTLTVEGSDEDGKTAEEKRVFTTHQLSRDQQIYPSVAPLDGETVGVGMPVIVYFDLPVKDKATFERRMHVATKPAVTGAWNWLSDTEAHWRPKTYWRPGTSVNVNLDLNGLPAGNGLYGQQDQNIDFTVGRSVVSTVDTARHTLTVRINGNVARTIPVSTGEPRFATRQGVKVIMEKFSSIDMDAATTGVDSEDPDYYDIENVRWAMRVTNSGEFLHAAPWSAGSHGRANVSHGCTGMGMDNAAWLYAQSKRGDVVEYINSPRSLEAGNGWTDWNIPWETWLAGSALPPAERQQTTTPPASPSESSGTSGSPGSGDSFGDKREKAGIPPPSTPN